MRVRIAAKAPPMVIAGSTRWAREPEPETGSHPSLTAKNKISTGPKAKLGNDRPNRLTTLRTRSSHWFLLLAECTPAGMASTMATNNDASVSCKVNGITLRDQAGNSLIEAQRLAKVSVEHAAPVIQILLAERDIESIGVARRLNVSGGRAFAEHLLNGIAGNEVDQQKDGGHDQPDDRQGVEDAGEDVARH